MMNEISVLLLEEGRELRPETVVLSKAGLTAILGQGRKKMVPLWGLKRGVKQFMPAVMVCLEQDYKAMLRNHARTPRRCFISGVDRSSPADLRKDCRERLLASYRKYGKAMFLDESQSKLSIPVPEFFLPPVRLFQEVEA